VKDKNKNLASILIIGSDKLLVSKYCIYFHTLSRVCGVAAERKFVKFEIANSGEIISRVYVSKLQNPNG